VKRCASSGDSSTLHCVRNLEDSVAAELSSSLALRSSEGSASPMNIPIRSSSSRPQRTFPSEVKRKNNDPMIGNPKKRRLIVLNTSASHISDLHEEIFVEILSYLVEDHAFLTGPACVSKLWHEICLSSKLWERVPSFHDNGSMNENCFRMLGVKNKGTEGVCYKIFHIRSKSVLALKKARVYPTGEGVPYYMLRELAFLQGLVHPNIATIERISLYDNKLHLFFNYVEKSLFDIINPMNDPNGGLPLPNALVKRLCYQILKGVSFCHQRGVLHRNIKPKHLLVDIPSYSSSSRRCNVTHENDRTLLDVHDKNDDEVHARLLEAAHEGTVKLSDFALVRATSIPLRNYTTEVVTLWYRSPEVLMGGHYFAPVDIWSVGCVLAEMSVGKPLFPGICEVDQLFQIFNKLGSPTEESWPGFVSLPNHGFAFPNWRPRTIQSVVPTLDESGADLLSRLLCVNPAKRITAEEALNHSYFDDIRNEQAQPPKPKVFGFGMCTPSPDFNPMTDDALNGRASCWQYANHLATPDGPKLPGLMDPAYLLRYYHYLKHLEGSMYPLDYTGMTLSFSTNPDQFQNTSDLLPVHRSMLVDWLVEVIDVFEMSVRSVFLAVNYTDRFLCLQKVERKKFQLLGATCLHIASKCEDVSYIGVDDLVVCADKVYKPDDVLALEEQVLNSLNFEICVPTVIDFLNAFIGRLEYGESADRQCFVGENMPPMILVSDRANFLAQYMTELSLQERYFISELPSRVAAASLVIALYYVDIHVSSERIFCLTGYSVEDLKECIKRLANAHADAPFSHGLHVILRRYEREDRLHVANIPAKQDLIGLFGR